VVILVFLKFLFMCTEMGHKSRDAFIVRDPSLTILLSDASIDLTIWAANYALVMN
jgi:hypothetical protein